ncbi:MAG: chemotaxis protein CheW [Thermomicrobiales bacterium]|jgi:purine-binding chemotaxis protein CheW|nr:MAG: chemotaxis protein CheW [Thermomicrobiales bacterium]
MLQSNPTTAVRNDPVPTEAGAQEFLTFALGVEEYAIDILKVQEIRGYDVVTTIANTPAFIKGVINLRGVIVPIVDMRIKFNLGKVEYNEFTVVIILNVSGRVVGMVVDSVSDVITLESEQIKEAPQFSGASGTDYITGIGTLADRMLILIDIERLMLSRDMGLADERVLQ